jgi:predicted O-methyltransferase YrrM
MRLAIWRAEKQPQAGRIAEAIVETLTHSLDRGERQAIREIEVRRSALERSQEEISIRDFGAGKAEDARSLEEMAEGMTKTDTVGAICRSASKPYLWSLLLFKLVRKLNPMASIELGTCLGISGSFMASAQRINGRGKLVTLEGAESLAAIAGSNFEVLGLDNVEVVRGRFQDTLPSVLGRVERLDFGFIDGHHDGQATLGYFEELIPHLAAGAVLVFDDISWSLGMRAAWEKIIDHPKVRNSFDLRSVGICVCGDPESRKSQIWLPIVAGRSNQRILHELLLSRIHERLNFC